MGRALSPVRRGEVLDLRTYDTMRNDVRREVMEAKRRRRIHVGDHLTFLFENHRTVWYQIQEMLRAERITREPDILHEIETYNELLGEPGDLGATLLIEIEDPALRDRRLAEWRALPEHVAVRLEDGTTVRARFDSRQRGEERLSSVQYLRFPVKGRVPVEILVDLPGLGLGTRLTDEQRRALGEDLGVTA